MADPQSSIEREALKVLKTYKLQTPLFPFKLAYNLFYKINVFGPYKYVDLESYLFTSLEIEGADDTIRTYNYKATISFYLSPL